MAVFTASLAAQNTSVYICDIVKRHDVNNWMAGANANGTFGSGTVTFGVSYNDGVTILPLNHAYTATAAALTTNGAVNLAYGNSATNVNPKLYASIGAATNPSISIVVADNTR